MRKIKVSDFCNTDLVDYASYSTLRMIASAIDGQKNTARKIVHTILQKNIKEKIKVSQLSSKMAEFTEFLHGDAAGPIVTLAQNYPGTNNVSLLERKGNFGTRFIPEASASRYIYTYGSKDLFKLFSAQDLNILKEQTFEGTKIEPLFYVPNLPVLLLNGAGPGMASGFKQEILPRNPKEIKEQLELKLNNKPYNINKLVPYFEGFNGTVTQGDESNKWNINGIINRLSSIKVEITELPVGISLKQYISILDKLEENKVIKSYKDKSKKSFHFEVNFAGADLKKWSDAQLLEKLKLTKKVSELYNVLDADNRVQTFLNVQEIFDYYTQIKMEYLDKRKTYLIETLDDEIRYDFSKYIFIKNIVEDTLLINKRKKEDIVKDIEKINDILLKDNSYDYLLNMSIQSLTEERMNKLLQDIKSKKLVLDKTKKTTLEDMWLEDLKGI